MSNKASELLDGEYTCKEMGLKVSDRKFIIELAYDYIDQLRDEKGVSLAGEYTIDEEVIVNRIIFDLGV